MWWGNETQTDTEPLHQLIRKILDCNNEACLKPLLSLITHKQILLSACCQDNEWLDQNINSPDDLLSLLSSEVIHRESCIPPGQLGKKRPDGIAVNWKERKVFLLEYTRCYDSEPAALARADTHKTEKYSKLMSTILSQLGNKWRGTVLPFSAGIRGTIESTVWTAHMTALEVRASVIGSILKASISAVLEALEMMFKARTTAMASLKTK